MGGQKPKNFKKAIGQLLGFMGKFRIALLISIVLAIGGVVLSIFGPRLIGEIGDLVKEGITGPMDLDAIIALGIIIAVLYAGSFVLSLVQGFMMATVTQAVIKRMRTQITQKINRLPLKYFDKASYGDILSRLTNDVDNIGQSLSQSVVAFFSSIAMLAGVLIMMFTINWIMALTAIAASVLGIALMLAIVSRSQKHFKAQQKYLGSLNGQIEETYSGHAVVKSYNAGKGAVKKFDETNENLKCAVRKANFFSISMHSLMNFVGTLGYVAVCVVGAVLMVNGMISVGVIISFMFYVRLFSQPLGQLAQGLSSLQSTAAASERVFEFLDEEEMQGLGARGQGLGNKEKNNHEPRITNHEPRDAVRGEVEFRNVKFGYVLDKTVIKDFSAKVLPGQKAAIVGPTGAGKTTLVNLLMRFYDLDSGQIMVDGQDVAGMTRQEVREVFGMVLQETWMFEGTIRENIAYNHQDATEEQIVEAAKAANLDHVIRAMPDGYDTVMDDKASLSAGQKQLVTIARAFVRDAPMLILDEATSSVDTRTEALIQDAMARLTTGRTTFVIAHRLSTVKNADVIFVLKDGDIIEKGRHGELLAAQGFYAELYNSQFAE